MKRIKILSSLLTLTIIAFSSFNCARNATGEVQDKVIQFTFKVKGNMILNRSDITYYLVLYAPKIENPSATPLDPNTGPRVNGPDLTRGSQFLEGRLPFIGQLPGDQPSKWTDFFYITFDGTKTVVGRGRPDAAGNPLIYDRSYANVNTKPVTGNTGNTNGYQIEFSIRDLNNGTVNNATRINGNLATSESIDNGNGTVFDNWKGNIPFAISLTTETQQSQQDINPNIVLRKIPSRPDPSLPLNVNADDVNIVEFTARVICDVRCDAQI
jgi:hypothetical protein